MQAEDPVQFDFAGASALAIELRGTASACTSQISSRNGLAYQALSEWRGKFADQFRESIGIGKSDAEKLAYSMHELADFLDKLVEAAHQENERRAAAKAYLDHKAHEGTWDHVKDRFFGEPKAPSSEHIQPPTLNSSVHVASSRAL